MGTQARHQGLSPIRREAVQRAEETGVSYTEAQQATKQAAIKRFLAVLEEGWSVSEAARQAGVSRITLYLWRDGDPEFSRAWDDAYGEGGSDFYEDKLRDRVLKGDTVALIVRLKQRGRFVERPPVGEDVVLAAGAVLAMLRQAAQRELPSAPASLAPTDGEGAIEAEAIPLNEAETGQEDG